MNAKHSRGNDVLKGLPPEAQQQIRQWSRTGPDDPVIRRANFHTQLKILAIHVVFFGALAAYLASGGHWIAAALGVAVLGLLALPFIRVYMHSQGHWGIGNGPIRNWLLDRGISILFSVPQTGYKYGHLAHHRYDNDFDSRGFPKDLQSTYIFSRDGKPTNIVLWCLFYVLAYQHAIHLFHVLNAPRRRELAWFAFEYVLIAAFHAGVWLVSPGFYLAVYLPSLVLAWLVSAVSLYMMHAVDRDDFEIHPTLNTRNRLFNWFGDNDGYHLEHSLYPALHPVFLDKASALVQPPVEQVLEGQYLTEALRRLFGTRAKAAEVMPAAQEVAEKVAVA
jgi:fatty acid desaturase